MWQYEKKLQYPVKIANPNPALAKVIISQLGGPDNTQRYRHRRTCPHRNDRHYYLSADP